MPGVQRTATTPKIVTPALNKVRALAAANVDKFIQTQVGVVDPRGRLRPFTYRWPQLQVAKTIKMLEAKGDPLRIFILKSRQVGTSTQTAARYFVKTWALDNVEALIFAQQETRAAELLDRCKGFYISLHPDLQLVLSRDSKYGLMYSDTRGKINIVSAKNYEQVRGGSKQLIQLSEWAHCKKPMRLLNEIEQPVDYSFGTEIIIETTGLGHGSEAHEFWKDCKSGKENYTAIFLKWQDDPNCTFVFESERDRDMKLGEAFEYEPRLKDRYQNKMLGLTAGNIYYSYIKLRKKCHGDYEFYLQEYPATDDEAWRATGQSYFGSENINNIHAGDFDFEYKTFGANCPIGQLFDNFDQLDGVEKLDENGSRPFIKLFARPRRNDEYVMASDSAEGEEDGNFSSTFVINKYTLEMMAEFHGRVRPDEHAAVIYSLGEIYNLALAAPEYNMPGNVTLHELKRLCYGNIYRWRHVDDHKQRLSNKLGWQTNGASRPMMLGLAKRIVEDISKGRVLSKGIIKSVMLLDEMKTFIMTDEGRPEAANGCADDRVMAWAICVIVAAQETYGSNQDILNVYRTQAEEPEALLISAADFGGIDPADVIDRFRTQKNQPIKFNEDYS